jgi:hypothetical protein
MKASVLLPTAFSNWKIIALKELGEEHVLPNLKAQKVFASRVEGLYECFVLSFSYFCRSYTSALQGEFKYKEKNHTILHIHGT